MNLFISCRKLPDMDAFSKSDPQCIVYERHHGRWTKVGKTEKISNNLNPDFRTSFTLAYYFEKKQDLKFKIMHYADVIYGWSLTNLAFER